MGSSAQDLPATIAVVDDDAAILDSIQQLLESYCWTVRIYETGEAFLVDLRNYARLDCLILDPHLAGMSGSDVMQSMNDGDADVPVIGLTARPLSNVTLAMTDAGAWSMLKKPVKAEILVEQVQTAINYDGGMHG